MLILSIDVELNQTPRVHPGSFLSLQSSVRRKVWLEAGERIAHSVSKLSRDNWAICLDLDTQRYYRRRSARQLPYSCKRSIDKSSTITLCKAYISSDFQSPSSQNMCGTLGSNLKHYRKGNVLRHELLHLRLQNHFCLDWYRLIQGFLASSSFENLSLGCGLGLVT